MQYQLALIPHEVEHSIVPQRATDGYVNATAMCQAAKKLLGHYLELERTKEFLAELSADIGIPISQIVIVRKGGNYLEQGTWVHPQVAINLGQWCSPRFAVAVARWVTDWLAGKTVPKELPYHLRRYMANVAEIPHTHFSMLNELTFHLIARLEVHGYHLPEHMVPDISEGRMFSEWLRNAKKIDPRNFPNYAHSYEDGRVVQARLYPIDLLPDFRVHFFDVWIPKRMIDYFKERDPEALQYFPKAFPALYGNVPKAIPKLRRL